MAVVSWFHENFGAPLEWEGEVLEPVKLKHGYQWASGKHVVSYAVQPTPMIWCNNKAYEWYRLRWE